VHLAVALAALAGCSGSASPSDSGGGAGGNASAGQTSVAGASSGTADANSGTAGAATAGAGSSAAGSGGSGGAGPSSGGAGPTGGTSSGGSANNDAAAPQHLTVPPLAFEDTHITVVWQKPATGTAASYNVYVNGMRVGSVSKITYASGDSNQQLFYDLTSLSPSTSYTITVRALSSAGVESSDSNAVVQATTAAPSTLSVTAAPYNAAKDGTTLATTALQKAISDCPAGGKVLFPAGKYLSGALYLKSNCTYQIDGTLVASGKAADYQQGNNRFPIYGTGGKFGSVKYPDNYKALLNTCGGPTAPDNACTGVKNIRLTGKGSIQSNAALATAEGGANNRGDLVSLTGVNGIYIAGLTLNNSSEHMLFIARSSNITVASVNDQSPGILNGDGIDLVTAYADQLTESGPVGLLPTNAYLFGSTWNNGDDCINLNSGTGAPGVTAATPLDGLHIFNNDTLAGHGGVVYGSYTAAGLKNTWADENTFNGTDVGFRFKSGSGHGGGMATLGGADIAFIGRDNIGNTSVCLEVTDQYPDTTGVPAASGAGVFHDISLDNYQCSGMNQLDTGSNIVVNGKALR
jgi:exo-poly-alpha-galacturonosidase